MNFKEFEDLIGKIFLFLGADVPTAAQKQEWFPDVKHIPTQALTKVWNELKQRDGISRRTNVPKVINEIYSKIASITSGMDHGQNYDPIEDMRFPVALMHRAFDVLERSGDSAFAYYCDSVRMPRNDRERVRNKFMVIKAAEKDKISMAAAMASMGRVADRSENPKKMVELIPF